jgi:hypothetical protein
MGVASNGAAPPSRTGKERLKHATVEPEVPALTPTPPACLAPSSFARGGGVEVATLVLVFGMAALRLGG